jgi:EAL domain-containing protein (putative c-di-GMP-specific phosphodiesterase class I)
LLIRRGLVLSHSVVPKFTRFIEIFGQLGLRFSIDQFGVNSTSFGFLQGCQLKVDGSYISQLQDNLDNQFFLNSLTNIAHNLVITILAYFVGQAQGLKSIETLGTDGAQGYYIGKPEAQE